MGIFSALNALVSKTPHWEEPDGRSVADSFRPEEPKRTVILIDDDQDILDSIGPALRVEGLTVLTATSGAKGLNLLRCTPHDVEAMLLDYSMPDLDGEHTLRHARKIQPDIKIIGITGLQPDELSAGYRESVNALFYKPVRTIELLASMRELLEIK